MANLALLKVPAGLEIQAVVLCTSTTRPVNLEPGAMISETDTGNVRTNNGTFNAPVWSSPINSASVDASGATKGQTRLTVNPEVATEPIAVGENDPDYVDAVAHKDVTGNPHGTTSADISAAPLDHVNSTDGHPVATTTDAGFMSATDKQKVHDQAHAISSETDHSDIVNDNKQDGRILVWRDAQSAHVYEDPAAASVDPASETLQGKVELATAEETIAGQDTTRATHPAGVAAALALAVPTGTILAYGGYTAPSGYVMAQGQNTGRTTFANLFEAITITTNGTTVNGSAGVVVDSSANMEVGMPVEGPGIAVGTTILTINSATLITLSANAGAGAGSGTIRALPWGQGNGTTNFTLPDPRGRALIGAGQGTGLTNRKVTQKVGTETHTLTKAQIPPHIHSMPRAGGQQNDISPAGGRSLADATTGSTGDASGDGLAGQSHPNMQPSLVTNYIIKT